jgi:DNA-binding response OmpR family regulator
MPPSRSPVILLIGSDASLAYLIERYAERSGCEVRVHPNVPAPSAGPDVKPAAVLFSSIADLEAAQAQIVHLSSAEIPLLVCSSINDQARALELGADHCLVHPLTYAGFRATLSAVHISLVDPAGQMTEGST